MCVCLPCATVYGLFGITNVFYTAVVFVRKSKQAICILFFTKS